MSTDDILQELTRYGRPRIYCHDDMTWSASLKCNTNTEGSDFEMKSGFGHATPLDAATELQRRTAAAMAAFAAQAQPASPAPAVEHKRTSFLQRLTR